MLGYQSASRNLFLLLEKAGAPQRGRTPPWSAFHPDGIGKLSGRLSFTLRFICRWATLSRAGLVTADRTDISPLPSNAPRSFRRGTLSEPSPSGGRTGCILPSPSEKSLRHAESSLSAVTPAAGGFFLFFFFGVDPPPCQTQLPADISRHSCQKITRFRLGWMN